MRRIARDLGVGVGTVIRIRDSAAEAKPASIDVDLVLADAAKYRVKSWHATGQPDPDPAVPTRYDRNIGGPALVYIHQRLGPGVRKGVLEDGRHVDFRARSQDEDRR